MARGSKKGSGSFDTLLAELEAGRTAPFYVLCGPETFLIEQALGRLKKALGEEDLSYEVLRGSETSPREIVDSARTVSMFSPRRLIVVRDASDLKTEEQEPLLGYLDAPVEDTTVVLVAPKVNKKQKLYAKAAKLGWLFEASSISERSLSSWIGRRAAALGLELSPAAIDVLGEATGTDLSTVEDALERLLLYVGDGARAGPEDVEAVVASSRVRSVFELTDAVGAKDLAAALRTLTNMLENREAPLRVLATLSTHLRRLLAAAELGPRVFRSPDELAAKLSIHPYAAKKLAGQVRRFRPEELRRALIRLGETDLELKSARRPDALIMEGLVMDLCRR